MRMLETTVAAIHPCWPEAQRERRGQGMQSAGLAAWAFGWGREELWLNALDLFLLFSTAWYTSVKCRGRNPFSNHCFLLWPLLLFILSTTSFPSAPSIFYLPWMIYTYTATQLSLFPFRSFCCVLILTLKSALGAKTSKMDPRFLSHCHNACQIHP